MTTSVVLYLATISFNPVHAAAVDEVDLIELNHFFDDQGKLVFDQVIYYDWSDHESRYQVCDWRLLKNPSQIPLRNWRDGDFVSVWHDFKSRDVLRKVKAKMVRETWTQYDPELVEREFLPEEKRRKLQPGFSVKPAARRVQRSQPSLRTSSPSPAPQH